MSILTSPNLPAATPTPTFKRIPTLICRRDLTCNHGSGCAINNSTADDTRCHKMREDDDFHPFSNPTLLDVKIIKECRSRPDENIGVSHYEQKRSLASRPTYGYPPNRVAFGRVEIANKQ